MFTRILAFVLRGKPVYLQDKWGHVYPTVAYRSPFGGMWARLYPVAAVGHVVLLDGGKIDPKSETGYIERWAAL